jgi:hypothetical protein
LSSAKIVPRVLDKIGYGPVPGAPLDDFQARKRECRTMMRTSESRH